MSYGRPLFLKIPLPALRKRGLDGVTAHICQLHRCRVIGIREYKEVHDMCRCVEVRECFCPEGCPSQCYIWHNESGKREPIYIF